jgi:hypothetical protein
MGNRDPFAHLRENLELHRAATRQRTYTWWCTECQLHQADESGLCPLCQPDTPAQQSPAQQKDEPAA